MNSEENDRHWTGVLTSAGWPEVALLFSLLMRFFSYEPVQFSPAVLVALVGLLYFLEHTPSRCWRWLCVWCWSVLFYLPSMAWIRHISVGGWVFVCAILGGYTLIFLLLWELTNTDPGLLHYVTGGLAWVVAEHTLTFLLDGFPYLFLSHAVADWTTMIQIADLTGAWGISFLLFLINVTLYRLLLYLLPSGKNSSKTKFVTIRVGGATMLLLVTVLVYGLYRNNPGQTKNGPRIGIVQGNISPFGNGEASSPEHIFQTHLHLSKPLNERADLIVWPETMYPYAMLQSPDGSIRPSRTKPFNRLKQELDTPVLLGATTIVFGPEDNRQYNSAYLLTETGTPIQHYHKHHLVPFGEYFPGYAIAPELVETLLFFIEFDRVPDLSTGPPPSESKLMKLGGHQFAPLICYEVAFPAEVRTHVKKGADFLVNLSNEGWYREESELDQMLAINQYRAVENRTAIVRATNTGISGIVQPNGSVNRLRDKSNQDRGFRGNAVVRPDVVATETMYTRLGNWFIWGSYLILALCAFSGYFRSREETRDNEPPANEDVT